MKRILLLPWLLAMLLFTACSNVPQHVRDEIDYAHEKYSQVNKMQTRSAMEAAIGIAPSVLADGAVFWETRFNEGNFARLTAWFNADGSLKKSEVTRSRHYSNGGFHSSAVTTK
jgi:hypothetical protein